MFSLSNDANKGVCKVIVAERRKMQREMADSNEGTFGDWRLKYDT